MDVFDIYFSNLVGWAYHPGNRRDGVFLTVYECAQVALDMMKTRAIFEREIQWQLLHQQQSQQSAD